MIAISSQSVKQVKRLSGEYWDKQLAYANERHPEKIATAMVQDTDGYLWNTDGNSLWGYWQPFGQGESLIQYDGEWTFDSEKPDNDPT